MRCVVGSRPACCSASTMFGNRSGSTAVMSSWAVWPGRLKIARDDVVAGLELVHEALAVLIVERGALAADGFGDQEALAAREADDRGGVELRELEVRELGAGRAGEDEAGAERARRVRRARPQRGGAAGGQQRGLGLDRLAAAAQHDAASLQQRRRPVRPRGSGCSGCSAAAADNARRIRRPVALPPAWMMRRRLCPPSRPSARSPWRSASNWQPSSISSRTRAAASSVRVTAAERFVRPRPASSVSSRWMAGESSTASAAAAPPWAQ